MRRWSLRVHAALIAVLAGMTTASAATAQPQSSDTGWAYSGRFDWPQHGFAPPWTALRDGSPERVGLDPVPIDAALRRVEELTVDAGRGHPMFPGAVTLLVHNGVVVRRQAVGHAVRYSGFRPGPPNTDPIGIELPRREWVAARGDTIFDMASVSKLFTSIVVLRQVETGRVELDASVARYLPEFADNGKESITVQQLLTHTSGLPPFLPLWRDWPDRESRIQAALRAKLQQPTGSAYIYSDLNLIALGVLVERVTGSTLDVLVRDGITRPLGMSDTGYHPPASVRHRIAATEYQSSPPRGMVRGEVHDENAWSLGGVAGHAGIFSTADDIAVLGQAILNGGSYLGRRILRPDTVRAMITDYNIQFPDNSHGLGFELDQRWYMDGLSGARTAGHTGFTGTSLVIDPASRSIAVLLTNRVHPTRGWGANSPARRLVAGGLAHALAVRPRHGDTAWFSGVGDRRTALLTSKPLAVGSGRPGVVFDAFVDTERTDTLSLESTVDNGATWQPVPLRARGLGAPTGPAVTLSGAGHRSWWRVEGELPTSSGLRLRWAYRTDALYSGRGVYLDGISVWGRRGKVLDGERDPDAFTTDDWRLAHR